MFDPLVFGQKKFPPAAGGFGNVNLSNIKKIPVPVTSKNFPPAGNYNNLKNFLACSNFKIFLYCV